MYHPKNPRPNKILWSILGIVAFAVMVLLFVFGGITIYEMMQPRDADFDEPPPAEKIDRVSLEYKVRMQDKQEQSARPTRRLQVNAVADMNPPEVDIEVPDLNSMADIGRMENERFGGLENEGLDVSKVNVDMFDMKAAGEKFLFVIDVSRELMRDDRGGLPTYNVIKEEIIRQIEELPSGVLFNLILYERSKVEAWKPELVAATTSNKEALRNWLEPVNRTADSIGIRQNNYDPEVWEKEEIAQNLLQQVNRGGSRNDKFLIAMTMLEQEPEAIYWFTDTLPDPEAGYHQTEENKTESEELYARRVKDARFRTVEEYREKHRKFSDLVREERDEYKKEEGQKRKKEGLPPRVYGSSEDWRLYREIWEEMDDHDAYVPYIGHPFIHTNISEREIRNLFERLFRLHYDQGNQERPTINVVVFKGKDEDVSREERSEIRDFTGLIRADHRILEGLGAIEMESD